MLDGEDEKLQRMERWTRPDHENDAARTERCRAIASEIEISLNEDAIEDAKPSRPFWALGLKAGAEDPEREKISLMRARAANLSLTLEPPTLPQLQTPSKNRCIESRVTQPASPTSRGEDETVALSPFGAAGASAGHVATASSTVACSERRSILGG